MKKPVEEARSHHRSPEAEAILDVEFDRDDAIAAEQYLERFDHSTTALALLVAQLNENGDEQAAEIVAEAVEKLAELEGSRG